MVSPTRKAAEAPQVEAVLGVAESLDRTTLRKMLAVARDEGRVAELSDELHAILAEAEAFKTAPDGGDAADLARNALTGQLGGIIPTRRRAAMAPDRAPRSSGPLAEIAVELATYRCRLPELLAHEGEYVVIAGEAIVGFLPTYEQALELGYDRCGLDGFIVKRVQEAETVHFLPYL